MSGTDYAFFHLSCMYSSRVLYNIIQMQWIKRFSAFSVTVLHAVRNFVLFLLKYPHGTPLH